jgi:hypothetical protein
MDGWPGVLCCGPAGPASLPSFFILLTQGERYKKKKNKKQQNNK